MFGEANAVMTAEGLRGLWRGVLPSLYRTVPGVGLYFSSMHWMRYSVFQGKPNAGQSLLIGAAARTFAGSVMIPFTVVKTRIESGAFQYRSVFTALESIIRLEGLRGLTRGLGPTLARDVPFSSLYLAFYDLLKQKVASQTQLSGISPEAAHMTAGLGAGLLASLVTQPADVVKTQMQLGKEQKNFFSYRLYLQGRRDGWVWQRPGPANAAKKCDGCPRLDSLREDHHLSQTQVEQSLMLILDPWSPYAYLKLKYSEAHQQMKLYNFALLRHNNFLTQFPSSCQIKAGLFRQLTHIFP